jgi:hypothetical protein
MSSTRSLVLTIVQLDGGDVAVGGHVTFPGLLAPERYGMDVRVSAPEDPEDWRDWARQVTAAVCEAL